MPDKDSIFNITKLSSCTNSFVSDNSTLSPIKSQSTLVVPGESIASSKFWMRGHGTYLDEPINSVDEIEQEEDSIQIDQNDFTEVFIRSSLAGMVERINKLVCVKAFRGRYRPEVGDLVVGRITEVQSKRWKVDTGSRQNAILMLGSVNLPGGVQRRKLESDELQMRLFFQEGDLLVAEVQAFMGDGAMSLHTRSSKYGKLRNGMLVKVPSQLILRLKSHFHYLPIGLNLIIGVNGWIWIAQAGKESTRDESEQEGFEGTAQDMYSDTNDVISLRTRAKIVRVAGVINLLGSRFIPISDSIVLRGYEASLELSRMNQRMEIDGEDEVVEDLDGFLSPDYREKPIIIILISYQGN
ncbi:hypothetical protein O181_079874 [Austropuccinia psidii MF-1]|uniref:Ribosomal RNA-processing protein 4 n=1 Tax=Austropuccinia psidii MF-1 TaxID=1389203 RepID=A0A9Q3IIN3_9BASI|nr:hypothetical protein [Austropuccinia psidii MF-1]